MKFKVNVNVTYAYFLNAPAQMQLLCDPMLPHLYYLNQQGETPWYR
jgi:hypothetical protein